MLALLSLTLMAASPAKPLVCPPTQPPPVLCRSDRTPGCAPSGPMRQARGWAEE